MLASPPAGLDYVHPAPDPDFPAMTFWDEVRDNERGTRSEVHRPPVAANLCISSTSASWARRVSNLRPLACEARRATRKLGLFAAKTRGGVGRATPEPPRICWVLPNDSPGDRDARAGGRGSSRSARAATGWPGVARSPCPTAVTRWHPRRPRRRGIPVVVHVVVIEDHRGRQCREQPAQRRV